MQGMLSLIRWQNCVMAALGVVIGARIMDGKYQIVDLVLSATATFLVCAVGNIVNDILDIDIDRINRPERVLPKGVMTASKAAGIALLCFAVSMILAMSVSYHFFLLAITVTGLLLLYNTTLKRIPIAGNAVIALMASLTVVTGAMVVSSSRAFSLGGALLPAFFAFILHLVREIVKDTEDIEGDRKMGVCTLPILIGVQLSLVCALVVLSLLPLALISEPSILWLGNSLAVGLAMAIGIPIAALFLVAISKPTPNSLRLLSRSIKIGMVVGMLSLIFRPL